MRQETWNIHKNASLDCYLHEEPGGPRPAMIVCPGGGYRMLTPDEGEPVAMRFFGEGYHAFVLNYPICAACAWPNATVTALQAVAYLRSKAKAWNIRPEAIVVLGFSAGGHVAASAGTFYNDPEVLSAGAPDNGKPDAMCLIYPVIGAEMPIRGGTKGIIRCDQRVTNATSPAFLATTYGDTLVSCNQSLNMALALSNHDVPFELHCYQPGNHGALNGGGMPGDVTGRKLGIGSWFPLCMEWLNDLFGPATTMEPPLDIAGLDVPPPFSSKRDHSDFFSVGTLDGHSI